MSEQSPNKKARIEPPTLEYASECALPTTWVDLPLLSRSPVNHDTYIFEFAVPDGSLGLPVCACLLLCAPDAEHAGGDAVRPYTPISPHEMQGRFQLLIKVYQQWGVPEYPHSYRPQGAVSSYLHQLKIGETAKFKHISFNIKLQYPFVGVKTITMIAVGAGIAPMIQALHKLLTTPGDDTRITLLYGNRTVSDILLRQMLEDWAKEHPRFRFVPVIGSRWSSNVRIARAQPKLPDGFAELAHPRCAQLAQELQGKLWTCTSAQQREAAQEEHLAKYQSELDGLYPVAELGWVNWHVIKKYGFAQDEQTRVFVCGLPEVYASLCGPRGEKEVAAGTTLEKLGYTTEMVVKF